MQRRALVRHVAVLDRLPHGRPHPHRRPPRTRALELVHQMGWPTGLHILREPETKHTRNIRDRKQHCHRGLLANAYTCTDAQPLPAVHRRVPIRPHIHDVRLRNILVLHTTLYMKYDIHHNEPYNNIPRTVAFPCSNLSSFPCLCPSSYSILFV